MQTSVEETDRHTVRLTIEVPPEEFGKDLEGAYRRIAQQVKIPGFRKGKIPRKVIDAKIGRDAVLNEFVQGSVPGYYENAVREHDLAPITEPDISIEQAEADKPLLFTATMEVRPRIRLEGYRGVEVTRPAAEVGEQEVDAFIERLRDRFAELDVVSRPARKGDFVVMDLRTTIHTEEIPEASVTDYLYEVGAGQFVEKLDGELEGRRSGEIVKVNTPLPETFGERAGKEATFQVLVKEVKAKRLPPADDEFAKTASEFDTMGEFRADCRAKLRENKERAADFTLRDLVLQALVERVDVDLPDTLVDEETESRVRSAKERAERAGMKLDDLLEAQGWDELKFRSDARAHAIRAIEADLVLESVARQEEIDVSAEDVGEEIKRLAASLDRDPKEISSALERSGQIVAVAGDIIRGKALDFLVEHAEIAAEGSSPDRGEVSAADAETPESPHEDPAEEP